MKNKKLYLIISLLLFSLLLGCKSSSANKDLVTQTDSYTYKEPEIEVTHQGSVTNSESEINSRDESSIILSEDEALNLSGEDSLEATQNTNSQVTICMVGDILLHDRINQYSQNDDGSYDYSNIFDNLRDDIKNADVAIVNQEVIIGGSELGVSGYPAFNAPYEIGDALADSGFDVVLHATNHALDKGSKGIINCLNYWQENHPQITVAGIHNSNESQEEINVLEVNGIKIALLNYTYGTNGISLPKDMPFAVDLLIEDKVREDIRKAKNISDFVIVCPHWGTEYRLTPDEYQKKWVNIFAEEEVDLIIGTHPHVIEPIELITFEETGHEMLVYYSLGNFINWTSGQGSGTSNRMVGGMANVTISRNSENEVSIDDYSVTALVTDLHEETGGVASYRLSDYSEEMALDNAFRKQDGAFSYEYCVNLCDEVWQDLWH